MARPYITAARRIDSGYLAGERLAVRGIGRTTSRATHDTHDTHARTEHNDTGEE